MGASNQLSIETEAELQIPNSDFETWSEKFVWKGTGKPGSIDIYTFTLMRIVIWILGGVHRMI